VFAPSMLLVTEGFSWQEFAVAFVGCVLGITFLSAALSKYFLVRMHAWERVVCVVAGILMVAPGLTSTLIGVGMVVPVLIRQVTGMRRHRHAPATSA
jgi:TRAP-type uncharacterized transport system fused permease subunit